MTLESALKAATYASAAFWSSHHPRESWPKKVNDKAPRLKLACSDDFVCHAHCEITSETFFDRLYVDKFDIVILRLEGIFVRRFKDDGFTLF